MRKALIVGGTSGIGLALVHILVREGWFVGVAGRRTEKLEEILSIYPEKVSIQSIDVTEDNADDLLNSFISRLGGIDLFILSSGIGYQNAELHSKVELDTTMTNVVGFTRMVTAAFNYFKTKDKGHIAVISSIAGTKGIGVAPAYSATKRYQNTYIEALEQLSCIENRNIVFTDIRPGFVKTDLLNDGKNYPLLMDADNVASKIYKALNKNKRIAIIDWRYEILVFLWSLIPAVLWRRLPINVKSK